MMIPLSAHKTSATLLKTKIICVDNMKDRVMFINYMVLKILTSSSKRLFSIDIFCRFSNHQKLYRFLKILLSIQYMIKPFPKDEVSSKQDPGYQFTVSPFIMKLVAKFLHIISMMYKAQEFVLQISTTRLSDYYENRLVFMYSLMLHGRHQFIIICL